MTSRPQSDTPGAMTTGQSLRQLAQAALDGDPDRPAIRNADTWYDWGWVRDTGAGVIELIEAGTARRDLPVGLVARNRPSVAAALLALIASGRSVRMVHPFQSARMLAGDITNGLGALIAADEDFSQPVVGAVETMRLCAVSLDETSGIGQINEASDSGLAGAEAGPPSSPPYIEVLTSGTISSPKPFAISYDTILRRLLSMNVAYPGRSPESGARQPAMMFFPLGNISGLYSYLPPILAGRPIVLQEKFDLDGWLDFLALYHPRRASLPVAGVAALVARDIPRDALAGLENVGTGGSAINVETQAAFEQRFGVPLLISYGATEFGGPVTAMTATLRRQWGDRKLGSAGRAWAGAKLRVVDPASGAELPAGTDGILEVMPTASDGWLRTSDLAMIDADGFLYHRGRADGAITRGGFAILPEVIERAIARHPQVAAAAVVGLSHRRLGEVPVAAVQPRDPADPPEVGALEQHVRDQVYSTHVPTQFRIVQELPLNRSLKVDVARVRALFEKKP